MCFALWQVTVFTVFQCSTRSLTKVQWPPWIPDCNYFLCCRSTYWTATAAVWGTSPAPPLRTVLLLNVEECGTNLEKQCQAMRSAVVFCDPLSIWLWYTYWDRNVNNLIEWIWNSCAVGTLYIVRSISCDNISRGPSSSPSHAEPTDTCPAPDSVDQWSDRGCTLPESQWLLDVWNISMLNGKFSEKLKNQHDQCKLKIGKKGVKKAKQLSKVGPGPRQRWTKLTK